MTLLEDDPKGSTAPRTTMPDASHIRITQSSNPLRVHRLNGSAEELKRQSQQQTPLLGSVALKGQATVIYAKPNTGKTLITLYQLIRAVEEGRIKGEDAYYVAADDTSSGVLEKLMILEPHGINVLAPGFKSFEAHHLGSILERNIKEDTAKGTFVILDTLKKFVSLMDKRESSGFAQLVRRFVMKGGTLLGLAHTNKRAAPDGKPIFAGTSDILDDFDCGYTIVELAQQSTSYERVVQYDCIKRRGDVAQQVAYRYSVENGISYEETLRSVCPVESEQLERLQGEADKLRDKVLVEAIQEALRRGIDGKMDLAITVAERCRVGRQSVVRIIDKYAGNDPAVHRWDYSHGDRGKHKFVLHSPPPVGQEPLDRF